MKTNVVQTNSDLELPGTYSASPRDETVLRELRKYEVYELTDLQEHDGGYREYEDFLKRSFKPIGLYNDEFLPAVESSCYKITFGDEIVAIFRLTPVGEDSVFHRTIPGAVGRKILEVNNVAVERTYQGDLLLGIILKNCAVLSHLKGYDVVAGLVRYDVLPVFVDFGTIPVRHEPLHLLGDPAIHDYVTYFMTNKKAHVDYALARSYHYFHRKVTMKNIDSDVKCLTSRSKNEMRSVR